MHATRSQLWPVAAAQAPNLPGLINDALTDRVAVASACLARVSALDLSDIGRGLAVSTYVLSPALYHAEFAGLCHVLCDMATRVSRCVAPGVPHALLTCRPADGGFGLLPFEESKRGTWPWPAAW